MTTTTPYYAKFTASTAFGEFEIYILAEEDSVPTDFRHAAITVVFDEFHQVHGLSHSYMPVDTLPSDAWESEKYPWAKIAKVK